NVRHAVSRAGSPKNGSSTTADGTKSAAMVSARVSNPARETKAKSGRLPSVVRNLCWNVTTSPAAASNVCWAPARSVADRSVPADKPRSASRAAGDRGSAPEKLLESPETDEVVRNAWNVPSGGVTPIADVTTSASPAVDQPEKLPVSKPPLIMPA